MKQRISYLLAAVLITVSGSALAVQQPEHMLQRPYFEAAQGEQPRIHKNVVHNPNWHHAAWAQFLALEDGTWFSLWDADTRVPMRIYGSGIATPGAVDSAERAERHARHYLNKHIALLAPGSSLDDFAVVSNQLDRGIRSVGFQQYHRGVPVLGGQVSFLFKFDRLIVLGSQALPDIDTATATAVGDNLAESRALSWISGDFGDDARVLAIEEPVVVPLVRVDAKGIVDISYTTSLVVTVETYENIGRWQVYVDAATGEPVARQQLFRFGSAEMYYNTPERWPGGTRVDYPALYMQATVNGANQNTDINGTMTWNGTGDADITVRARGPYVRVANDRGGDISAAGTVADGTGALLDVSDSEFDDSQLTTFIHGNVAKEYARVLNPGLNWLDAQMTATVNINDVCNAFSDGNSIYFFSAGTLGGGFNCGNTGRLVDVVYHEFGHSLHGQSVIPGQGNFDAVDLSEGIGDYYAATLTGDPAMGRGFFLNNDPLRHIDPVGSEMIWPDDIDQDPHVTGLIIAGALWDLRKALVINLGEQAGIAQTDRLFYSTLQRAADIPDTYPVVLAEDDDNGNLADGTPNSCYIDEAFAAHGLADDPIGGGLSITRPERVGLQVSFDAIPPAGGGQCEPPQVLEATLAWRLREDPVTSGNVPMTAIGDTWSGQLPIQEEQQVIQYQVVIELDNGSVTTYPDNDADPWYEFFVGGTVDIYCTDFEVDPFEEGWTTGGTGNDWGWGTANGQTEDPGEAYSGTRVLGNNLNGRYGSDSNNYARSPNIDVSGYETVRLQYRRWLYVEDGFWDTARITANGTQVWQNANSDQGQQNSDVHHTDREWRFHDVDVTDLVQGGTMQIGFELQSDQALEFGGWTIDDFCLVAYAPSVCGDGVVSGVEGCDNGNDNSDNAADACRSDCQPAFCGDGVRDTGEQCDDGNDDDTDLCSNSCIGEDVGDLSGGCCDASATPSTGTPALIFMVLFGLAVLFRRRRRTS